MRDGSRTRARIEAEAIALFAAKGVDATSIRDIAQASGVAEGALYRHFRSKDDLVRRVFLDRYAALAGDVLEIGGRGLPFAAVVELLVRRFATLFEEDRALFTFLFVNQHMHLGEVPVEARANPVEAIKQAFGEAMDRGEIPRADPDLLAALALGLVVQPAIFRLYGRIGTPLTALLPAITRAVLAATSGEHARVRVAATYGLRHKQEALSS